MLGYFDSSKACDFVIKGFGVRNDFVLLRINNKQRAITTVNT